jgi:uncharacterized protein
MCREGSRKASRRRSWGNMRVQRTRSSPSDDVFTRLMDGLRANEALWGCLHRFPALNLSAWYLGAGCVAQTIWNLAHGKAPHADILDYDLVYYDRDLSEEAEDRVTREARELVADLQIEVDVTNEARVHIWYPERFGYSIQPYQSTEDAIGTWPTTATAIGVRPSGRQLEVWAPFGLVGSPDGPPWSPSRGRRA